MLTAEFEQDVIQSGNQFRLPLTTTSIAQRTSRGPGPFVGFVVAIIFRILLSEMNIRILRCVTGGLLQVAYRHKRLHLGVSFMLIFGNLQQCIFFGGLLPDNLIPVVTIVVAFVPVDFLIFSRH
jgi:hypothetical protein